MSKFIVFLAVILTHFLLVHRCECQDGSLSHNGKTYFLRGTKIFQRAQKKGDMLSWGEARRKALTALEDYIGIDASRFERIHLERGELFEDGEYIFRENPKQKTEFVLSGVRVNATTGHVSLDVSYESIDAAKLPVEWKVAMQKNQERRSRRRKARMSQGRQGLLENKSGHHQKKSRDDYSECPFNCQCG